MFVFVSLNKEWLSIFIPVNIIVVIGVLINIHKLALAGWNRLSIIGNLLMNAATLCILFVISRFNGFVVFDNPELVEQKVLNLSGVIDKSIYVILAIIAVITIYDAWSNIKWLRNK